MKAAVHSTYGPPEVVQVTDVEKPSPKDGEVRVRVHAASVNPLDWHFMRGTPRLGRVVFGVTGPRNPGMGVDVAGEVDAVGRSAARLKPGDAVFGVCKGAFAEYTCVAESQLVVKPQSISFQQAASVPIAGLTALQGLRDHGGLQPGQKLLINGAAGGVGTFAVQIAKVLGATVTGVCSTRNLDLVRSIGADEAIDYTREDFTRRERCFDLFFDCVGNRPLSACRRVLTSRGTYVAIGGGTPDTSSFRLVRDMFEQKVVSWFASQKLAAFIAKVRQEDLASLSQLLEIGRVVPVIDREFPLDEVAAAIRYIETGHARGKVVVTVA